MTAWGNAKERQTLQCCAQSQSARYRLDIISGVVLKILSGYISGGTWSQGGWRRLGRSHDRMPSAGRMDSGTNNSGPDDTDNGGCERDWGFETHSRRTFTRLSTLGHDSSASGARSGTPTTPDNRHRRRRQVGWGRLSGRALSFSHYTTEGIFIHGGPPLGSFLEPPRPRAAAPRRRRVVLEWEFSLTISGNSQIIA